MDVRGFALVCALGGLVLGTGGCLLFTGDFNQSPQVAIAGPKEIYRGQPGEFHADVVDGGEASDSHSFDWGTADVCPTSLAEAVAKRRMGNPLSFERILKVPRGDKSTCVFVIVTDRAGAQSFAVQELTVKSRKLSIREPETVERGKPATFTATFLADDGSDDKRATDLGSFTWGRDKQCQAAHAAATATATTGMSKKDTSFPIDRVPKDAFCLSVIGKDEFGADSTAELEVTKIINNGPVAAITMVEPVPAMRKPQMGLFTEIRLSGADAQDLVGPGGVNLTWAITVNGQMVAPKPCPMVAMTPPPASDVCFSTDMPGQYRVNLTVTEDGMTVMAPPLELMVEDTPPCIRQSEPNFLTASKSVNSYDQPRSFGVLEVSDDADPLPSTTRANQGEFIWSTRLLGEQPIPQFTIKVGFNFRELTLPARQFQAGDKVEVRVQYFDRQDLANPMARDKSSCKPEDARCELVPGSGCFQRVTWTVTYL